MFSPKFSLFWLVGVLCIFLCAGYSNTKSCVETDKQALLKLKDAFIDEWGILSTWKSEVDCCQWSGISCNNLTGHVIKLDLQSYVLSNRLRGNIDSSLCDLQHLIHLNLEYNDFEGSKIPKCIGSLGQLRELILGEASIGGTIPHGLQNLSNLQTLDLSDNPLIVNDLEWISHLFSLRSLDLRYVNLSRAIDWQSSLSNNPYLSEIYLDSCSLMSHHVNPKSFFHINSSTSLKVLGLRSNYLDSSILPWLSNISKVLEHLYLYENNLEHIFPHSLNINSLKVLDLMNNSLQLSPRAFSNMNSLESLNLASNSLQYIPSDAFANATSLEILYLYDNKLDSNMAKSIPNLCQLKELWLSDNNFSGQLSDLIPQLRCAQYSLEMLYLSDNPFSSGLFPDFSRFSSLVTLDLENTSLHGSIPQSFGHLPYLSGLLLSNNNLSGSLPKFIGLKSLKYLELSNNKLYGNIPPSAFEELPNLVRLDLSSNKLNISVINEMDLSTLSTLKVLYLSQNLISFNFSSSWVPPFQLQEFSAPSCKMGPHFPRWLKYQRELVMLDISDAAISDSIPQWFWLSPTFQYLNLSHNKIYGELPKSFLKIYDFYTWDLSFNNLSGPLPYFPPFAGSLLLSNNMFSGTISIVCAAHQPRLYYLDLSSNLLFGRLPDCWEQLPWLFVLKLSNNYFSGAIPSSVGTLKNLKSIHFNNNNLSGNLPSLMNSPDLRFIDFGQNNLNGKLPSWIGHYLPNLIGLRLQANKFQGSIPTNLCNLPLLQILDLSQNNITGRIPHCFDNLSALSNITSMRQTISFDVGGNYSESSFLDNAMLVWKGENVEYDKNLGLMTTIDLSCNQLIGEIPSSITTLVALASLNLSRNNLTGFIPNNMGQMTMLESLDLSNNYLSGEIPISFSTLSFLSVLNLSCNNLSGKIPVATQLQTFNASSYIGNQGLCGLPLTKECPGEGNSDLESDPNHIDANEDDKLISFGFYVSMALGFIVGFWGVFGSLILKSSWRDSFFQFLRNMNDWIYVQAAIIKAKINRRFKN